MANATFRVTTVPAREVTNYELTLSEAEALFLADLLALVGGSPATTRRRYANFITEALREVGIVAADRILDVDRSPRHNGGTVYFTNEGVQ